MFKTASFFRIGPDFLLPPLDALEEALHAARFVPCGATQPESHGWIPPRGKKSITLAESVGGQVILNLCIERRAVPASAVKAGVDERVEKFMKETGQERVSAKIKKEFKEEVVLDLLPRAFTKRSNTLLWIDAANKLLVVGTGSLTGADKVITALVEALSAVPGSRPAISFKPVQTNTSAAVSMSQWLSSAGAAVQLHGGPRLRAEDAGRTQIDGALFASHARDRRSAAAHRRRQGADAAGHDLERPAVVRADRDRRR